MRPEKEIDSPPSIRSASGHEFEVLGPAAPLRLKPAPRVSAEAGGDLIVVKEGPLFACSRRDGDIRTGFATGEGFYCDDTRFLSELVLRVGRKQPILLSWSASLAYEAFIDLTNATLGSGRARIPQMALHIRRVRLVADRLFERVEIHNYGRAQVDTDITMAFGADFADMFEVRGAGKRPSRGHAFIPRNSGGEIRFAYLGEDELFRETIIEMNPEARDVEVSPHQVVARWRVRLEPGEIMQIETTTEASLEGKRSPRRSFRATERKTASGAREWLASCMTIEGLNVPLSRVVDAGLRDLKALITPVEEGEIIVGGIPWYVAPFGRDSLLTCAEMLMVNAEPARQTLLYLAKNQATVDDPLKDAEPGKILHESRTGELARGGFIPHSPYYGSVDSTPLFLMLAAAYWRWTDDLATMRRLRGSLDAALQWIDEYGDRDGDGFVEYMKRSPAGLDNQGWKDSENSIVHADGSRAEGPIALVEVQGYVYLAKLRIADVYDALGDAEKAASLRIEAERLKTSFNEVFWMPEAGTFALALDGRKEQVQSLTSNPGHCLYCDIVDKEKAEAVARRLMAPDMFSGWGVRTLSSDSPAYNPMSYHNGSVWPHDNAITAAGLKRYGFSDETERIAVAIFGAALQSRDARLPELYCGFNRRDNVPFVAYPVACSPQAWAAAVPFMMLQSMLGVSARAHEDLLTVHQPNLPAWMGDVRLIGIRVGNSRVNLAFSSDGVTTSFAMLERAGDVRVTMHE